MNLLSVILLMKSLTPVVFREKSVFFNQCGEKNGTMKLVNTVVKKEVMEQLQQKPLEQIWRDHMLAGSILQADDFYDGFFVFLYPKDNNHCSQATKDYRNCLTDSKTFEAWVIEDVVSTIEQFTQDRWIHLLYDRYLDFDKLYRYREHQ